MRRGFLLALLLVSLFAVSAGQVAAATKSGKLVVYVDNSDDDTLKVGVYVDGTYRRSKWVFGGDNKYISSYYVEPGEHEVKITWQDPDVCASSYEKSMMVEVGKGETKKVIISTERNTERVTCAVTRLPCELTIRVKNLDDDDLWVDMLLDKYSKIKQVKSGSIRNYGAYRLREGEHTVQLKWYEPDAFKMMTKTETINLEFGDEVRKTFYIDRYTVSQSYTGFLRDL